MLGGWVSTQLPFSKISQIKQSLNFNTMEQAKTFVLTNKKTWRREVRVFVMNVNKKFEERLLSFTTEHRVNNKQRTVLGRNTAA
jgi:hypothetical protein